MKADLKLVLDHELVRRFREMAHLEEIEGILEESPSSRQLYFTLREDVESELRRRGPDVLRLLAVYYGDPSPWVRVRAAQALLAIDPAGARPVLEAVKPFKNYIALEAGMCLFAYDNRLGRWENRP